MITETALGPNHPNVASCLGNLGAGYFDQRQFREAASVFLRALTITEAAYGADHPDVAVRLGNLAAGYHNVGRIRRNFVVECLLLSDVAECWFAANGQQ